MRHRTGASSGGPAAAKHRRHRRLYYVRSVLRKVWKHPANRDRRVRACVRAVGWQIYKRATRRPLTLRAYGMRVRCYPDSTAASNLVYFGEFYEYDEMTFLTRYIRRGDLAVDGGANIGTFSLFLASLGARVLAVEPDRVAASRLRENVALNGLDGTIEVIEAALAEKEGTASFSTGWDVSNRLVTRGRSDGGVNVRTVTLDSLASRSGQVALAKLDLEGGEHGALLGATSLLESGGVSMWMIEAIGWRVREAGGSRDEISRLLTDAGYDLAVIEPATGRLALQACPPETAANFFALSRGACDRPAS